MQNVEIQAIMDKLASKYVFDIYTLEDIKQEAWVHALEAKNRITINQLETHLRNRLAGWKRSKIK